jgi:eukaryotic-like serine/threonine-protein kinase
MLDEQSPHVEQDPMQISLWAFERAWQDARAAGRPGPDPLEFLVGKSEGQLFRELVHGLALVDLEHRLKLGEPARVDEYVGKFPSVEFGVEEIRELVQTEYVGRLFQGDDPPPNSYRERFPAACDIELSVELSQLRAKPINDPQNPRYRIISPHRRGGSGLVYLAFDRELRRRVALKEIDGYHDSAAAGRWQREAQIAAQLDHPGIVSIHGSGQWDNGRPYYVMRFVAGCTLAHEIDRLHGARSPGAGLSPRELRVLLDRFKTACQAIAHAHDHRVAHLDLKPSNILLGPYGETVVIDWGSARRFGQRADPADSPGTPAYMSPEQAHHQLDLLDAKTDIFNLGGSLYHLLTGRTPFGPGCPSQPNDGAAGAAAHTESRGAEHARQMARTGECVTTRQIAPGIDKALEAICLKAMDRDPEKRYPFARDLVTDLEQWLADEPVAAWRERFSMRARRWMRRHRTLASSTAAVLLCGLVGLVVFAAVLARKNRELEHERKAAVDERARAVEVLTFFQEKVLVAARPGEEGGLGVNVTLRKAIDTAEPGIERSFASQPLLEASIRHTLGETYYVLGERAKALRQFELVAALRRRELGPDHVDTLESTDDLAGLQLETGRFDEGLSNLVDTLKRRQTMLGPDQVDILTSKHNLAYAYRDAGRLDDAISLYEETLRQRKAKLGADHGDTLLTMRNLSSAYRENGRYSDALLLFDETWRLRNAELPPDHRDMLMLTNNVAQCYLEMGCYTQALSLHRDTLRRQRSVLGEQHPDTLLSMSNVGLVCQAQGRLQDAVALLEETWKHRLAKLGPNDPETVVSASNLANAYAQDGRLDVALPLLEETLKWRRAKRGPEHPQTLRSTTNLARAYLLHEPARAEALLVEALAIRERRFPDDWRTFETRALIGACLLGQKRFAEAESPLTDGYYGMKDREVKIPAPSRRYVLEAGSQVVKLYEALGKKDEAAEWRVKIQPSAVSEAHCPEVGKDAKSASDPATK